MLKKSAPSERTLISISDLMEIISSIIKRIMFSERLLPTSNSFSCWYCMVWLNFSFTFLIKAYFQAFSFPYSSFNLPMRTPCSSSL